MQFAKFATAAVLAMGVTTFAVAQERAQPNEPLNRSTPSANVGTDHDKAMPKNSAAPADQEKAMPNNRSRIDSSGTSGASGGDARASTGASSAPSNSAVNSGASGAASAQVTEKNVTPMLQAQGYTDVKSIKRSGDTITANAKKDGKSVKLKVDAKSGAVTESRS